MPGGAGVCYCCRNHSESLPRSGCRGSLHSASISTTFSARQAVVSDGDENHWGQNSSRKISFNSTFDLVWFFFFTPKIRFIYHGQTHSVLGRVFPTGCSLLYQRVLVWFSRKCFHPRGSAEAPFKVRGDAGYQFLSTDTKGGRGHLCSVHIIQRQVR